MNNTEKERVFEVVYRALQLFNEQLPAERRLVPTPECELVGSSNLDSAEIVNLLVTIEQQVEQDLGITITLFDAIDQFVSVEALANFLAGKVKS
jgi:acyl carrier protein